MSEGGSNIEHVHFTKPSQEEIATRKALAKKIFGFDDCFRKNGYSLPSYL
jgi:hypothetical protein